MSVSKTEDYLYEWWLELGKTNRRTLRFLICFFFSVIPASFHQFLGGQFFRKPDPFIIIAVTIGFLLTYTFSILLTRAAGDRKLLTETVAKLAEANANLEKLCCIDSLTNLHNRAYLDTAILKTLKRAIRDDAYIFSIMMDVDKLKDINDNYGHDAGDEVIRGAGTFISRLFRDDDFIIRRGGDEFEAIGATSSPKEFLKSIQEKFIPFPVDIEGEKLIISISYGYAFEKVAKSITDNKKLDSDIATYAKKLHRKICSSADTGMYLMKKKR